MQLRLEYCLLPSLNSLNCTYKTPLEFRYVCEIYTVNEIQKINQSRILHPGSVLTVNLQSIPLYLHVDGRL